MRQKVQKTLSSVRAPKLNIDKKCLTLSKKNQKNLFKHIRFGRSNSPGKGLSEPHVVVVNLKKND
jgi:hypothetical protein